MHKPADYRRETLAPSAHQVFLAAKMSMGRFDLRDLAPDSLPIVIIVGISACFGVEHIEVKAALALNDAQYRVALSLFRSACVQVAKSKVSSKHHQIVQSADMVADTVKKFYIKKQYVQL